MHVIVFPPLSPQLLPLVGLPPWLTVTIVNLFSCVCTCWYIAPSLSLFPADRFSKWGCGMGIGEEGVERREMEGSIVLKPPFVYVSVCVCVLRQREVDRGLLITDNWSWVSFFLSNMISIQQPSIYLFSTIRWWSNFLGKRLFLNILPPLFICCLVFIHGERDLSSLPCLVWAVVQISLKTGECCVAVVNSVGATRDLQKSRVTWWLQRPRGYAWKLGILHFFSCVIFAPHLLSN